MLSNIISNDYMTIKSKTKKVKQLAEEIVIQPAIWQMTKKR